ncbi:MAG: chorismate synthase [Muribaculaceae bacterium]|nr:chorismate synthase [Muribaculaceae bacterium]
MSNTFGKIYRLTTFGESHGPAIGGIIDGVPAGVRLDLDAVQHELDRRRPGQSDIVTGRRESDTITFLSGIFEGVTTGTPIGFTIPNADQHSADYDNMRGVLRPSHADFTYTAKYGVRDHRGGGRSSARETASRVVGGAIARQILSHHGITIAAYTSRVGAIAVDKPYTQLDLALAETNAVRCPDHATADAMIQLIRQVKAEGDTVGGIVTCVITGVPAGLGEPVADRLNAMLAGAMLSINAAKGFEIGMGFDGTRMRGSQVIDPFTVGTDGRISTTSNHSGGIQGGISNGADIWFNVAFKPVATLLRPVDTITESGDPVTLQARGRHDPCVVARAVPVVEAMAAMTLLDAMLMNRSARL